MVLQKTVTKMIPTILGFPLWKGRIKNRVAKKHLKKLLNGWMLGKYAQQHMAHLKVGDFVNDCSGKNSRIVEMHPIYHRIGKGYGSVLLDVDLQTGNTGCSLTHCGVEPKLPREVIEKRMLQHIKEWTLGEGGQTWYGKDSDKYLQVVDHANKLVLILESGGHVTNEDGEMIPEYEFKI